MLFIYKGCCDHRVVSSQQKKPQLGRLLPIRSFILWDLGLNSTAQYSPGPVRQNRPQPHFHSLFSLPTL